MRRLIGLTLVVVGSLFFESFAAESEPPPSDHETPHEEFFYDYDHAPLIQEFVNTGDESAGIIMSAEGKRYDLIVNHTTGRYRFAAPGVYREAEIPWWRVEGELSTFRNENPVIFVHRQRQSPGSCQGRWRWGCELLNQFTNGAGNGVGQGVTTPDPTAPKPRGSFGGKPADISALQICASQAQMVRYMIEREMANAAHRCETQGGTLSVSFGDMCGGGASISCKR